MQLSGNLLQNSSSRGQTNRRQMAAKAAATIDSNGEGGFAETILRRIKPSDYLFKIAIWRGNRSKAAARPPKTV